MVTRSDPPGVARHDNEHLRRFLAARAAGDGPGMRRWWDELVVDFHDRMDGLVAVAHRGRLDAEEHDLAVAMAMARFCRNLIHTFDGRSMGELVNATRSLARGICIDVQRVSIRRHRLEGPSLDAGWMAAADDRPVPAWEADEAVRRFERAERAAEAADFLEWALPQVGDGRRKVLELTFQGAQLGEIVRALGISEANAYQRRSRGLKDLQQLKERYDA